ncbi:MAG: hypothetical protein D6805_00640 [Planctomycetota bacterium]|nr:MAG: hypothetical protein D6805_00640 [Planctomycetota bacterium]
MYLWQRVVSFILFVLMIGFYLVAPFVLVMKYVAPAEKKILFQEAVKWRESVEQLERKAAEEKAKIQSLPLDEAQRRQQIQALEKKVAKAKHQKGKEFHHKLLEIGITPDIPLLIGFYFLLGVFLFWFYRKRAKTVGIIGKVQYTVYLFVISLLLIITTFGFGYTATYIYNQEYWKVQPHPKHPILFVQENPIEETPFIATHFVLFALNAAAMGPFDAYMTVKPNSLEVSLMQWLERLFVISVLFSSISRLWLRNYSQQASGEKNDTVI